MALSVEAISQSETQIGGGWTCHWPSIDEKNSFSPQARTDSVEKFVRSRIPNMKCAPAATRCAVLTTNSCTLPCTRRRQHPTFEPAHTQGERQQVPGKLGRTGRGTRELDPNPRTAAARGSTARPVCPPLARRPSGCRRSTGPADRSPWPCSWGAKHTQWGVPFKKNYKNTRTVFCIFFKIYND